MSDDKTFVPEWTDRPPKPGSWRSIAKFGKPDDIAVPSPRYFELLKRELGLTDDDFRDKPYLGDDPVAALVEFGGRLVQIRLVGAGVDLEEQVARLDELIVFDG